MLHLRGEATHSAASLRRVSAMGTPLVLLSRPVWNRGAGISAALKKISPAPSNRKKAAGGKGRATAGRRQRLRT
jgi:hypothetical protein